LNTTSENTAYQMVSQIINSTELRHSKLRSLKVIFLSASVSLRKTQTAFQKSLNSGSYLISILSATASVL